MKADLLSQAAAQTDPTTREERIEGGGRRGSDRRLYTSLRTHLLQLCVVALFLFLWTIASDREWVNPLFISSPAEIWTKFLEILRDGTLIENLRVTVAEAAWGFGVGTSSGLILGYCTASVLIFDKVFTPMVVAFNAAPRLAMVPLFLLWFGIGTKSITALIVTVVFPLMFLAASGGVKSVDRDLVRMARLYGAGRGSLARRIVIPSSVPSIFAGLRIAMGYSLTAAVVGEMIASRAGIGNFIAHEAAYLQTDGVMAGILVVVVVASVLNVALGLTESRLLKWRPEGGLLQPGL